jgi:hypothetical protein
MTDDSKDRELGEAIEKARSLAPWIHRSDREKAIASALRLANVLLQRMPPIYIQREIRFLSKCVHLPPPGLSESPN